MVLPTADGARLAAFYESLGFALLGFQQWQTGSAPIFAIGMGDQKINVHPETVTPERRAKPDFLGSQIARPGCGDVCVVWEGGVDTALALLDRLDVPVEAGPVLRTGARGGGADGVSVYVRDPDRNLVELMSYAPADVDRYRDGPPRG